jgi:predicted TPR repeat methyltransferase
MEEQMSDRYQELQACYDHHAKHFVETRKKNRPEIDYVKQVVKNTDWWNDLSTFVEIGCGWGRLYSALESLLPKKATYTWVDFAAWMIDEAKQEAPQATWIVDDMIDYIRSQPQESIDCLLWIASVQHIKWAKNRALFFADAYRALNRWWMMILTNRSYSERFLKKYRKQIAAHSPKIFLDYNRVWNDVMVPRKDHTQATEHYLRYYHLFTLHTNFKQLATPCSDLWFVSCLYVAQRLNNNGMIGRVVEK